MDTDELESWPSRNKQELMVCDLPGPPCLGNGVLVCLSGYEERIR